MDTEVVTDDMNPGEVIRDKVVEVIEEGDELRLPFASETSPVHSACPGIKSGKEIEGAIADVFVFNVDGLLRFCWFSGLLSGTGL